MLSCDVDNVRSFIACWNVYSGLYLETDGTDRRTEAIRIYSEMGQMMGKTYLYLAENVRVDADYFPMVGKYGEMDWIMGFRLTLFGHELGRIHAVAVHFGSLILACEDMTVALKIRGGDVGKADQKA